MSHLSHTKAFFSVFTIWISWLRPSQCCNATQWCRPLVFNFLTHFHRCYGCTVNVTVFPDLIPSILPNKVIVHSIQYLSIFQALLLPQFPNLVSNIFHLQIKTWIMKFPNKYTKTWRQLQFCTKLTNSFASRHIIFIGYTRIHRKTIVEAKHSVITIGILYDYGYCNLFRARCEILFHVMRD